MGYNYAVGFADCVGQKLAGCEASGKMQPPTSWLVYYVLELPALIDMILICTSVVKLFAVVALLLAVASVSADGVLRYNERIAAQQEEFMRKAGAPSFGIYGDYGDPRVVKRLILVPLTLIGWLAVRRLSAHGLAAISYGTAILIFGTWVWGFVAAIMIDWNLYFDRSSIDLLSLVANPLDYLLMAVVVALFMYEFSSFARSLFDDSSIL